MIAVSRDDERLTWVGHATVLLELGGARLLTDPLLRTRLGHLRRHGARPDPAVTQDIDAVLVSHVHLDHLDVRSLRSVARGARVVAPQGAGRLLRRIGFARIDEVVPGDRVIVGDATITALAAVHDGRRLPLGATVGTLGYEIAGGQRVYFAGDTELFDGMRSFAGRFDVALLPVWGWGPYLGSGHMDPGRAAIAAQLLRARLTIPIHWGALFPRGFHHVWPDRLHRPPRDFARIVRDLGADLDVRILEPGDRIVFS